MSYKENDELGWAEDSYASYYKESDIDKFLNLQFFDTLSENVKNAIEESTIEVTSKESYFGEIGNPNGTVYNSHTILRKVFLLSTNNRRRNSPYL